MGGRHVSIPGHKQLVSIMGLYYNLRSLVTLYYFARQLVMYVRAVFFTLALTLALALTLTLTLIQGGCRRSTTSC